METRWFRTTVVGCALSWFMVGLHVPALHAATHDGHAPPALMLSLTLLLAAAGLASLWALLRARAPTTQGPAA